MGHLKWQPDQEQEADIHHEMFTPEVGERSDQEYCRAIMRHKIAKLCLVRPKSYLTDLSLTQLYVV